MNLRTTEIDISQRDDFYSLLAWIKASQRRVEILRLLRDGPMNTTEFATDWSVTREAVQYHLNLLRQGGPERSYPALVRIITPDRDRYRLWGLTEYGESLAKELE